MKRPRFPWCLAAVLLLAAARGGAEPPAPRPTLSLEPELPAPAAPAPTAPKSEPPTLPPPAPVAPLPQAACPAPAACAHGPLTICQAEDLAQKFNPILQRDLARLESARGQALQASLYPNPRFDTNNPEVFAGRNSQLNVGVQQEVVTAGKLRLDTAAAEQLVRQAELTFQQNRLALLTSVRRQFYTVLILERRVRVLTELAEVLRAAVETARKLEKAGETSKIDTLLLTVDLRQVEANLRRSETLLVGERKQLSATVGVPDLEMCPLAGDLSAPPPDFDEEVVRRYATTGSTIIQIARSNITRNKVLLQRAKVEPIPNVNLGPAYAFGVRPGNEQFWLTLTFPIPAWDRNQGNIRAAQANLRDAQESLRVTQNDQLQRVADALGRYLAARQLAEQYEREIMPTVRQAFGLAQEGYAKGVFDFARYLQAQRTVVETNLNSIDAVEALWTGAVDVADLLQLDHWPGCPPPH